MRHESGHEHNNRTPRPSTNGSSPPTANGSSSKSETNGYHTNGHAAQDTSPFYGHDREEVTRILLQSLSDLGYHGAAKQLSSESGYELEIPSVAAFRAAVLGGEWEEAEALLLGSEAADGESEGGVSLGNGHASSWRKNGFARQGLPLAEAADTTMLKFQLRQQKYLELLETRDLDTALSVLRNELTPLKRDIPRLHALSSLMMCQSGSDVRQQADWDGSQGASRSFLLSTLSTAIAPSVMIPSHRLATLLSSVQDQQIEDCTYHNSLVPPSLYTDHTCSADDFPLEVAHELRHHADEVWFVTFSPSGSMLATAGQDGLVCLYDTATWTLRHEMREHERGTAASGLEARGVCYLAFSPDDQFLISCSLSKEFVVVRTEDARRVAWGDHFDYPVITASWLPDSTTFVVGTQGSRRPLGLYSLRPPTTTSSNSSSASSSVVRNNELHSFRSPPWDPSLKDNPLSFRTTDCAINTPGTVLVACTLDNRILLYSLLNRQQTASWSMPDKLTSITFSSTLSSPQLLLNMNGGRVWALDAESGEVLVRYEGVVQKEFVVRSCFGGAGEGCVVSGSEDGRVYLWKRATGGRVAVLEAVQGGAGAVNCVAWCPGGEGGQGEGVWASGGDDRRVRM